MLSVDATPRVADSIALPGGSSLTYAEFGPAAGLPVLYLAGSATDRSMSCFDGVLDEHDIRLITVDRRGLGASTPDPRKTFSSVGADLGELMRALELDRMRVVAYSQGAPFGLAFALTDAVEELILVSPVDEFAYPPVRRQLPEATQALVVGAEHHTDDTPSPRGAQGNEVDRHGDDGCAGPLTYPSRRSGLSRAIPRRRHWGVRSGIGRLRRRHLAHHAGLASPVGAGEGPGHDLVRPRRPGHSSRPPNGRWCLASKGPCSGHAPTSCWGDRAEPRPRTTTPPVFRSRRRSRSVG